MRFRYGFPSVAYDGSKAGIAETLVKYLPPRGRLFFDLFSGRGNMYWGIASLARDRFSQWGINDFRLGPWFEALLTHGHKLSIPTDPEEIRREFTRIRLKLKASGDDYDSLTPTEKLLEPHLSFGGRGYKSGGPAGTGSQRPEVFLHTVKSIREILLQTKPRITANRWDELSLNKLTWDDVVYLDPPYFGCKVHSYDAWGLDEYEKLIRFLKHAPFKWMLSEYRRPMYVKAFREPKHTIEVRCGISNDFREECVWTNY